MNEAVLVLEDGESFRGRKFGANGNAVFEIVFNTSLTGYQEILTDPSYRGQGIVFTAPHIGNVGVNIEDYESGKPQVSAIIVRSLSPSMSNWRAYRPLDEWLEEFSVPGICDVDTRYLTRKIREQGTMKAAISTSGADSVELLNMINAWPGLDGMDMVKSVTISEPSSWEPDAAQDWINTEVGSISSRETSIVVVDYGAKSNIFRQLHALGAKITAVPAFLSSREVMAFKPDGIVLSNGPGDPAGIPYAIQNVKDLIDTGVPLFGICLGHQLIGLALGAKTERLTFGHHGGNHPVQDLKTCKTMITSQNHNFVVVAESLDSRAVEITHISLNDGSVEGLKMRDRPVFSVQFHPEASPGPHDAFGLFDRFFKLIHKEQADAA
jgi:carbamoyl-phosphate synthase small subunit